jgi:hypothetical protein
MSTENVPLSAISLLSTQQSLLPFQDKDKEFKIDWKRVGITSSFGFAFVGPVGHYWLVLSQLHITHSHMSRLFHIQLCYGFLLSDHR